MFHTENKILSHSHGFKLNDRVKTVCKIYAGPQKDQKTKLTQFPAGTIGVIRSIEQIKVDNHYAITYYLVKIQVDRGPDKKQLQYWAKLNGSCIKPNE